MTRTIPGAGRQTIEDFESFASWDGARGTANDLQTKAGTLRGVGAQYGSGATAIAGGMGVEVRDTLAPGTQNFTTVWGRQNLSVGGKNWLDSNDLNNMVWTIPLRFGPGQVRPP